MVKKKMREFQSFLWTNPQKLYITVSRAIFTAITRGAIKSQILVFTITIYEE
jgi:hypothetical protein